MKRLQVLTSALLILGFQQFISAQSGAQKTCAVLNVEATPSIRNKITHLDNISSGTTVRRELEKLGLYQVAFRQDMERVISSDDLNRCFDTKCLLETGQKLEVDRVISGSIEYIEGTIIISLRELDVNQQRVINSKTKEFRFLPEQLKFMVEITLREMYNLPVDAQMAQALENKFGRDDYTNNPGVDRLNLTGFRVGAVAVFGENATIMRAPYNQGGFDIQPYLFQFGYQFETQYLNQGRLQALFEVIPMISGIEKGLFIPSMAVLHGLRDNKTGLEFAFGGAISLNRMKRGYLDDNNTWIVESDWDMNIPRPSPVWRLHSSGMVRPNVGFVAAAGFSVKSGNLNIPMNVFMVSQKKSVRLGVSVGINGKGRRN